MSQTKSALKALKPEALSAKFSTSQTAWEGISHSIYSSKDPSSALNVPWYSFGAPCYNDTVMCSKAQFQLIRLLSFVTSYRPWVHKLVGEPAGLRFKVLQACAAPFEALLNGHTRAYTKASSRTAYTANCKFEQRENSPFFSTLNFLA